LNSPTFFFYTGENFKEQDQGSFLTPLPGNVDS
jgi:hypothetical protein